MRMKASIRAQKNRSKTCKVVRRQGRLYIIDKMNPRNKVRVGFKKRKKA
jgi:large subunit ribosomal protein L36